MISLTLPQGPPVLARPSRPDIVLVVLDDLRINTLRWMPTVWDEVVRKGERFTRAMVPTSLCCPSRASLLTGLYAHDTTVWSNTGGWSRFVEAGMEDRSIAVWLAGSGYRTGLIGKYMNAYGGTSAPPGWSFWRAFQGSNADYYDYQLRHEDGALTAYGSAPSDYSTDVLRRLAIDYIRSTPAAEPFFLYLAPYAPHSPATPAPRHRGMPAPIGAFDPPSLNEPDVSDKPPWIQALPGVDETSIQRVRARQYRSLRAVDDAIRVIMDVQRERSRLQNTLLLVISDNGVMWGEHRLTGKFVPYASATRVPLVIRWPGRVAQGVADRRLALNVDVPATIAAAAEADAGSIDGIDLLSTQRRTGSVVEAGASSPGGSNGTNLIRPAYCGWRTGRYLYVRYATGIEELYDYVLDPYELHNGSTIEGYREVISMLRSNAQAACQPPPPGFSW